MQNLLQSAFAYSIPRQGNFIDVIPAPAFAGGKSPVGICPGRLEDYKSMFGWIPAYAGMTII